MNDDVQSLRQQLASAQARLQEYTDIIISQANELRLLRDNICHSCKERFTPAPKPSVGPSQLSASVHSHSRPSEGLDRKPFWRRILPTKRPGLTLPHEPLNVNSEFPSTPKPSTIQRIVLPQSSNPTPSAIESVSTTEAPIPENNPQWSVEYQTTENRALDVTFVRAFAQEVNVVSVKFSPNGKYLAVSLGSYTGKVIIFEVQSATEMCVLRDSAQKDKFGTAFLCFTPDSRRLAITDTDNRIKLWEISKKHVQSIYKSTRYLSTLDISPNGRFFVASARTHVTMWRLRDSYKTAFHSKTAARYALARFSPNGLFVVAVDSTHMLWIWNVRTGCQVAQWSEQEDHMRNLTGLRCCYHKSLQFWTVGSVGISNRGEDDGEGEILLCTGPETAHLVSATVPSDSDSRWVLCRPKSVVAHIWDAGDGIQQCSLIGHTASIVSGDFSAKGDYLVLADDKHVSLWSCRPSERLENGDPTNWA